MTNKIVVLGSLNIDQTLHVHRLPQPGETIKMTAQSSALGGKGANQAVAARRTGLAQTAFIGRVGADAAGKRLLHSLAAEQIDIQHIQVDPQQGTGQAYVLLQDSGENSIIIYGGSNQALTTADVQAAHSLIQAADFLIAQCEIPLTVIAEAFAYAQQVNTRTILNPAPVVPQLPAEILEHTDLICPNETEAQALTGIAITDEATLVQCAQALYQLTQACSVITVGDKGAYLVAKDISPQLIPASAVPVVDTTAAGDTFIGAMVSQLQPDFKNLVAAVRFACQSSALTVQSLGAQPSIPTYQAVQASYS